MHGTITLNGIYDPQLATIIHVKERHESSIKFNPQQMQPIQPNRPGYPPQPPPPPGSGEGYDNVVIVWDGENGLVAITEMLHRLYPNLPVPPYPEPPEH